MTDVKHQKAGLDATPSSHLSRKQQHDKRAAAKGSSSVSGGGGDTPAASMHAQQSQEVAEHLRQTQHQKRRQGQRRRKGERGRSAPTTSLGTTRSDGGRGEKDPRGGAHGKGEMGGVEQQQKRGVTEAASVPETTRNGWEANGSGGSLLPAWSASPTPASETQSTGDNENNRHGRLPAKRTVRNQVCPS